MLVHLNITILSLKRFLFAIRHHFLNSTRSPTQCLSRITDEKELNPTPGDVEERSPISGTSYIQTIHVFEVHTAWPYVFRGSWMRDIWGGGRSLLHIGAEGGFVGFPSCAS